MNNGSSNVGNALAGAVACLKALRKMEEIATQSSGDFYDERALMVSTLTNAAEPLSSFMLGFVSTLAEYIDLSLSSGQPASKNWRPEASMSQQELESSRAESYANVLF